MFCMIKQAGQQLSPSIPTKMTLRKLEVEKVCNLVKSFFKKEWHAKRQYEKNTNKISEMRKNM